MGIHEFDKNASHRFGAGFRLGKNVAIGLDFHTGVDNGCKVVFDNTS